MDDSWMKKMFEETDHALLQALEERLFKEFQYLAYEKTQQKEASPDTPPSWHEACGTD